jgi:hypothetical protein
VPLTGHIFREQDGARAKAPRLAVAYGDFHFAAEIHDELTPRCVVPIDEVLRAAGLSKDDSFGRDHLRHHRRVIRWLHLWSDVLEMRFSRRIRINPRIFHALISPLISRSFPVILPRLCAQLIEEGFGVDEVGGVEAFGEPFVDVAEHRAGLFALALFIEQPRETCRR